MWEDTWVDIKTCLITLVIVAALVVGTIFLMVKLMPSPPVIYPTTIQETDNSDVNVDLLFEHEGVKVYRFVDNGRYVYYSDARGSVEWTEVKRVGKSTIIESNKVDTVK